MDSSVISISEILTNAESLISAGFSAGYNFDETDASRYFDELLQNAAERGPIFSGLLIIEKSGKNFTIVDGLQRITTISLLLCALCDIYKGTSKNNEEAKNKILKTFLVNKFEPKLKLNKEEQEIYKKIIFFRALSEEEKSNNLFRTYQMFLDKIKENKITGTQLFKIILRIKFMTVITEKSEIPARDLYQAINLSKDKSQINLISDFILKKSLKAGELWQETIDYYNNLGREELFKNFVKDFLIIQNDGKLPHKNALYTNFKTYFIKMSAYQDSEKIVENICKYAKYYLKIIQADFEQEEIIEQINILNQNNGQDAYSYLMEVLDDLENGHIDLEIFSNILMMINSFIVQRQEAPLAGVTVDFATLSKEINKMLVLKDYAPKITDEDKLTINEINQLSTFEV